MIIFPEPFVNTVRVEMVTALQSHVSRSDGFEADATFIHLFKGRRYCQFFQVVSDLEIFEDLLTFIDQGFY